jgi:GAF domain-containing protein
MLVDVMAGEQRWSDWARTAVERGAGSSMSIPVPVQGEVSGALNIYGAEARAFDARALETGTALAAYASVALANIHLYEARGQVAEQLQSAMQSRAVIEQAKGILMGARRCTADEAFAILADLSQRSNRKLRDVAQALVQEAGPTANGA